MIAIKRSVILKDGIKKKKMEYPENLVPEFIEKLNII